MTRRVFALGLIAAVKVTVSLGLLWFGFRSVSDDDFARVVIAQDFALRPTLDPSATSWLPLPFWVYGGAMKAFGGGLVTAQLTAILIGVYAAIGVYAVSRAIDRSERAALIAALLAAVIPHAATYGAAMLPDYPTAVLALGAVATLRSQHGSIRAGGALLAGLATLCRYETWPIAVIVALFALRDALRRRAALRLQVTRRRQVALPELDGLSELAPLQAAALRRQRQDLHWLVGSAVMALAGIMLWTANGVARHGDAFFFIKRVTAYRRALGGQPFPLVDRLLQHPLAVVTGEPELVLCALVLAATLWFARGPEALQLRAWRRPCIALGALLLFLVLGDILDGAPTHHEERTLLTIWLALALLLGEWLDRLLPRSPTERQPTTRSWRHLRACFAHEHWTDALLRIRTHAKPLLQSAAVAAGIGAASYSLRTECAKVESFVDRSREIDVGRVAAEQVPNGERLAIFTEDYGFFAVQAAFARPRDATPILHRDPRHPEPDPFATADEFAARLDLLRARYLIVPASHRQRIRLSMQEVARSAGFVLMRRTTEESRDHDR